MDNEDLVKGINTKCETILRIRINYRFKYWDEMLIPNVIEKAVIAGKMVISFRLWNKKSKFFSYKAKYKRYNTLVKSGYEGKAH